MVYAENRKVHHDYEILETYEAGIVLEGHEVKSIKTGSGGYKTLVSDLAKLAKQAGGLSLSIEASASKVPTVKYGTNENLAKTRGESAKSTLMSSLKAKGVTVSVDVNINPRWGSTCLGSESISVSKLSL